MKNLYLVLILIFPIRLLHAQTPAGAGQIKGKVIDSATRKPLDFITISLKNDKKVAVKTALTKADGSFAIQKLGAGTYTLDVVAVGYKPKSLSIKVAETGITDAGVLAISASNQQLKEVSITATRPLVVQEVDRIGYDVQADPESKALNVLDLMRKVPLLSLDADDNIKLKGSGNYKVLINGKPSSMVARNPKDVFRAMPASSIQKIEVITTPPAKYDAEGLAGIINIITNKKIDNGYNGNINFNQSFPVGGPGGGGSFTLKQGKFGTSTYFGTGAFNQPETNNFSNRFTQGSSPTSLTQTGVNTSKNRYNYLGSELSFEIDTLNLVTGEVNVNTGNYGGTGSQLSQLFDLQNSLMQGYRLLSNNDSKYTGIDLGINYQLGFKRNKEQLLTFSYKYSKSAEDQTNQLNVQDAVNYPVPNYEQFNNGSNIEQTIQADYVQPIGKKLKLEAGVKGILRDNKSDFQYQSQDPVSGNFIVDPTRSNNYNNNQDILGAYNSYQYNLKNWGFKAGMRIEQTIVKADFVTTSSNINQNYFNVIPSVSINRKFKDMSNLNFGFTQRIQRPNIYNLNPFVDRSNPNFYSTGNPDLRPVLSNSIEFGYSKFKKGSININFSYSFANNTIQQVAVFEPATNITRTTYQNIGKDKSVGGNFNVNYPFTPKWNFYSGGNLNYVFIQGIVNGVLEKNNGIRGYIYGGTSYKFDKGWRLNANYNYNSPYITLQGRTASYIYSSIGLSKEVVKDKLTFTASANNPYSKFRNFTNETSGANFNQINTNEQFYRNFRVGLNWRFGKLKSSIKKNERGIKNDDSSGGGGAKSSN